MLYFKDIQKYFFAKNFLTPENVIVYLVKLFYSIENGGKNLFEILRSHLYGKRVVLSHGAGMGRFYIISNVNGSVNDFDAVKIVYLSALHNFDLSSPPTHRARDSPTLSHGKQMRSQKSTASFVSTLFTVDEEDQTTSPQLSTDSTATSSHRCTTASEISNEAKILEKSKSMEQAYQFATSVRNVVVPHHHYRRPPRHKIEVMLPQRKCAWLNVDAKQRDPNKNDSFLDHYGE
uniref:DEP domain-containing protein n=1 Tax=Ascaris lumbricoides TaxID=6252 RepID=A0A0M3HFB6_ASCLU